MTEEPRLIDIATALKKRGRSEEADYYEKIYPQMISLIYDIPLDKLLYMTVEEISELQLPPEKPAKYGGWDNFWFGSAAFGNHS